MSNFVVAPKIEKRMKLLEKVVGEILRFFSSIKRIYMLLLLLNKNTLVFELTVLAKLQKKNKIFLLNGR